MTSLAESLRQARDLLLNKGWVQYTFNSTNGYCILNACHTVVKNGYNQPAHNMLLSDMRSALHDTLKESSESSDLPYVMEWNDTPGRTLDEVLALFDQTIANVLEQEIRNG